MLWRFTPFVLASLACLAGFRSNSDTDQQLIRQGLTAWNKPDSQGRACVSCHSPQGLELAFYNFDDGDLLRRAEAHVTTVEAQTIVGMIHARRREYKIYSPLDPMKDRPLQPGGAVLPGASPADRDYEFAREIDRLIPLMTRGDVDSLAKAREAEREILALNLRRLPVGISFNRISEDGFHGPEHAMIADWIPDTPVTLTQGAIQARDAYQQDASEPNLSRFISEIPLGAFGGNVAHDLAFVKYRSLLRLQAQMAHPEKDELSPKLKTENPFWDLAELARGAQQVPLRQIGLPDDIRLKKEPGPPLAQQFLSMKLPWYWTGWMSDPGLQRSRVGRKDRRGDYFGFSLLDDGPYPMHCAFMFFRKQMTVAFIPAAWNSSIKQHFEPEYSTFLLNKNFMRFAPKDANHFALYRKFVLNAFHTSLYLLLDETRRTNVTGPKFQELSQARTMADYIEAEEPSSRKSTEGLLAQIAKAFEKAKELPA
jgi:hypothetical protein